MSSTPGARRESRGWSRRLHLPAGGAEVRSASKAVAHCPTFTRLFTGSVYDADFFVLLSPQPLYPRFVAVRRRISHHFQLRPRAEFKFVRSHEMRSLLVSVAAILLHSAEGAARVAPRCFIWDSATSELYRTIDGAQTMPVIPHGQSPSDRWLDCSPLSGTCLANGYSTTGAIASLTYRAGPIRSTTDGTNLAFAWDARNAGMHATNVGPTGNWKSGCDTATTWPIWVGGTKWSTAFGCGSPITAYSSDDGVTWAFGSAQPAGCLGSTSFSHSTYLGSTYYGGKGGAYAYSAFSDRIFASVKCQSETKTMMYSTNGGASFLLVPNWPAWPSGYSYSSDDPHHAPALFCFSSDGKYGIAMGNLYTTAGMYYAFTNDGGVSWSQYLIPVSVSPYVSGSKAFATACAINTAGTAAYVSFLNFNADRAANLTVFTTNLGSVSTTWAKEPFMSSRAMQINAITWTNKNTVVFTGGFSECAPGKSTKVTSQGFTMSTTCSEYLYYPAAFMSKDGGATWDSLLPVAPLKLPQLLYCDIDFQSTLGGPAPSATATASATASATPTASATTTHTSSATASPTGSASSSATATATATATSSASASATASSTASASASSSASATASASSSGSASATATATRSAIYGTATASASASATATSSASATATESSTASASATASTSAEATSSATASASSSAVATSTATSSASSSSSATASASATATTSASPTPSSSPTPRVVVLPLQLPVGNPEVLMDDAGAAGSTLRETIALLLNVDSTAVGIRDVATAYATSTNTSNTVRTETKRLSLDSAANVRASNSANASNNDPSCVLATDEYIAGATDGTVPVSTILSVAIDVNGLLPRDGIDAGDAIIAQLQAVLANATESDDTFGNFLHSVWLPCVSGNNFTGNAAVELPAGSTPGVVFGAAGLQDVIIGGNPGQDGSTGTGSGSDLSGGGIAGIVIALALLCCCCLAFLLCRRRRRDQKEKQPDHPKAATDASVDLDIVPDRDNPMHNPRQQPKSSFEPAPTSAAAPALQLRATSDDPSSNPRFKKLPIIHNGSSV